MSSRKETHLLKVAISDTSTDFPSFVGNVMDLGSGKVAQVHVDVFLEGVFGDLDAVQVDFEGLFRGSRNVINSLLEQRHNVIIKTLHTKFFKVRLEGDLGPVCRFLGILDFRLALARHVVGEHLLVHKLLGSTLAKKLKFKSMNFRGAQTLKTY